VPPECLNNRIWKKYLTATAGKDVIKAVCSFALQHSVSKAEKRGLKKKDRRERKRGRVKDSITLEYQGGRPLAEEDSVLRGRA